MLDGCGSRASPIQIWPSCCFFVPSAAQIWIGLVEGLLEALNWKLPSILRTWNRSLECNAFIWLTCVKCKQRWKLMKRRIFRGRKLDPPIPFGWAAHTRLGFRQLGDNRCDKLPNLMGKSKELAARHFSPFRQTGSAVPIVTSAGSACSPL